MTARKIQRTHPLVKEKTMAKKKNAKKARRTPKGRRNLSVVNNGDTVTIRNRSVVSAGIFGIIIFALIIVAVFKMKAAWELPLFWVGLSLVSLGIVYSSVNAIFSKIVLDSPNTLISVYRPFEKQYKFSEVNYVDINTSKLKDGPVAYTVILYIGIGKKTVEVTSYSKQQAEELLSLFRGMLDNGAMEYPEGNEEPFHFDDEDKKERGFAFLKRKNKDENKMESDKTEEKAPEKSEEHSEEEKSDETEKKDSDEENEDEND